MFLIRDSSGEIYNRVNEPAIVIDLVSNVILKIGEYDDMENYFNHMCNAYRDAGFNEMALDLAVMHIPKQQEEIDKIFNNSGYIKKYTKQLSVNN